MQCIPVSIFDSIPFHTIVDVIEKISLTFRWHLGHHCLTFLSKVMETGFGGTSRCSICVSLFIALWLTWTISWIYYSGRFSLFSLKTMFGLNSFNLGIRLHSSSAFCAWFNLSDVGLHRQNCPVMRYSGNIGTHFHSDFERWPRSTFGFSRSEWLCLRLWFPVVMNTYILPAVNPGQWVTSLEIIFFIPSAYQRCISVVPWLVFESICHGIRSRSQRTATEAKNRS